MGLGQGRLAAVGDTGGVAASVGIRADAHPTHGGTSLGKFPSSGILYSSLVVTLCHSLLEVVS